MDTLGDNDEEAPANGSKVKNPAAPWAKRLEEEDWNGRNAVAELYEALNAVVEQRLKETLRTDTMINLPDLVDDFAASLADVIVCGDAGGERERLIDYAI